MSSQLTNQHFHNYWGDYGTMTTRTYERKLIFLVKRLAAYIGRWQPQLVGFLTAEELQCIQSLLVALTDCIAVLAPPAEGD